MVNPSIAYSSTGVQAEVAAIGAHFPNLAHASSGHVVTMQHALIQTPDDFQCGGSCVPDLAGIAEASLNAALDIGITGGLSRVKESSKTVARYNNRLGTRANAPSMRRRIAAIANSADSTNNYLTAEAAGERAIEISAAKESMTAGDVAQLTAGA